MSGIGGVLSTDGKPIDPSLLRAMGERMAHRGPDGEESRIQGPVGMVCRINRITPESVNEVQPLVDSSGTILVFDGRLDDREELLARLPRETALSTASSDPEFILAAYHAFGDRFPEYLNGDFALTLFDPREQKLLLARDALGIRPLHYAQIGSFFLFASEVKAILAYPRIQARLNSDLLADLFLGQVYDHELTFFSDIFSVAPAHVVIWTRKGLSKRRYWDFDPSTQVRFSSFPEYAEAFRTIFERAVSRRMRCRHPVGVSLSGGVDSSSIYCVAETLARREGSRPSKIIGASYISRDGAPSDEKSFLLDIEKTYATSVDRLPIGNESFLAAAEEATWHMEMPMLDEQGSHVRSFYNRVRSQGARVLLTGHWADQFLFTQAYLSDLTLRLRWGTVLAHLREYARWMTDTDPACFRRSYIRGLIKQLIPRRLLPIMRRLRPQRRQIWFSRELRQRAFERQWRRPNIDPTFRTAHARSLYEEARTGYHVLCMEWQNKIGAASGLETAFPFLDRDLISFLMAVPGEMQTHQGVPKALLREAMRGVLPESIANRRWKADFTYLVNEIVRTDFDEVVRLIRDGKAKAGGYLDTDAIEKYPGSLRLGLMDHDSAEGAWSISEAAGLEVWLRVFCGDAPGLRHGTIHRRERAKYMEVKT